MAARPRSTGKPATAKRAARGTASRPRGPSEAALLRLALDGMTEACALFDGRDRLVLCNRAFARLFAFDPALAAPGTPHRDQVRGLLDLGLLPEAVGRETAWLREHAAWRKAGKGARRVSLAGGRTLDLTRRRAGRAGILLLARDVPKAAAKERQPARKAPPPPDPALATLEARFRALFQNAPVAIGVYDFSRVKHYRDKLRARGVTDLAAHLRRHPRSLRAMLTRARFIEGNREAIRLAGAADHDALVAAMNRDLREGCLTEGVTDILAFDAGEALASSVGSRITPAGEERHFRSRSYLDPAHRGDWARVVVVVEDITEVKRAHDELAAYTAQWQEFLDAAPMAIAIKDREGRYQFANRAVILGLHCEPGAMIGRTVHDFIDPAQAAHVTAQEEQVIREKRMIITERHWPAEGEHKAYDVMAMKFPITDGKGRVTSTGLISVDITDQRDAQRALAASEARWQAFLENAPFVVALKDEMGQFVTASRFLADRLHTSREALVGKRIGDLVPPALARIIEREDRQVMQTRRAMTRAQSWPALGAVPAMDSLMTRFPILDEGGRVIGTGMIETDVTEQVRAQQALKESEDLIRTIADNAPTILWMNDAVGRTTFCNEAWYAFTGASPADVPAFDWDARVHPEDLDRFNAYYRRLLETKTAERIEYRCRRHDGQYRWLLESAVPRFDAQGAYQGAIGASLDVTESKELDAAVHESEERFRTMADDSPIIMWVDDADGNHLFVNRAWRELTGVDPAEGLGQGWRGFVHPDDIGRLDAELEDATRGRRSYSVEYRWRRHDGQWRWLLDTGRPRSAPDGSFNGFIGSCLDITVAREAQEALAESEQRFRSMADDAPFILWVDNEKGEQVFVNRAWEEMTGRDPKEGLGDAWHTFVHPADIDVLEAIRNEAFPARVPYHVQYRWRRHDGQWRWLFENAKPRTLPDGTFAGYIGSCIDMTDMHDAERALKENRALLRSAIDSVPAAIDVRDAAGNFLIVNQRLATLYGTTPRALEGRVPREVRPAAYSSEESDALHARVVATRKRIEPYERTILGADDTLETWVTTKVPLYDDEGVVKYVVTSEFDVTPLKRAQEALARSEIVLKQAQQRARLAYWNYDRKTGRLNWSENASAIMGLPPGVLPQSLDDDLAIIHPDDREAYRAAQQLSLRTGGSTVSEFRIVRADNGKVVWLEERGELVIGQNGERIVDDGTIQDITALKHAQFALAESETRLRNAQERARLAYWFWDAEDRAYRWSENAAGILGVPPEALSRGSDYDTNIVHPDDREAYRAAEERFLATGEPYRLAYRLVTAGGAVYRVEERGERSGSRHHLEYRLVAPDGTDVWIEEWGERVDGPGGRRQVDAGTMQNITDRKRAEEALVGSERRLRDAQNRARLAYWHYDAVSETYSLSEGAAEILDVPPEALVRGARYDREIVHPDDRESYRSSEGRFMRSGQPLHHRWRIVGAAGEIYHVQEWCERIGDLNHLVQELAWPDGRKTWFEEWGERTDGPDGKRLVDTGTMQNITDRKRAEQALAESERRLRDAQDRARLAYWHYDLASDQLHYSDNAARVMGLPGEMLSESFAQEIALVHPDDRAAYIENDDRFRRDGGSYHQEYRIVRPDGTTAWIEEYGDVELDEKGRRVRDVGTIQDITERKVAEQELRENRARLAEAQRRARIAYWYWSFATDRYTWSDEAGTVLGLDGPPPDAPSGYMALVHDDDRIGVADLYRRMAAAPERYSVEYRMARSDGETVWVRELGGAWQDAEGKPIGLMGTVQDITDVRRAEEALRLNNAMLRAIIDVFPGEINVKDADGRYVLASRPQAGYFGLKPEEFIGKTHYDVNPGERNREYNAWLAGVHEEIKRTGQGTGFVDDPFPEPEGQEPGKRTYWISSRSPLKDAAGKVTHIVGISIDITDRRVAEEALKLNNAMLMAIIDAVPGTINVKDSTGRYVLANRLQADYFGLQPADFLGKTHHQIGPSELYGEYDEWLQKLESDIRRTGEGTGFMDDPFPEPEATAPDDRTYWMSSRTPIKDEAGQVTHIVGVSIDITPRRRAEEQAVRRGAALAAVSKAAVRFLAASVWRDVVDETLAELGRSVEADACYVLTFEGQAADRARVASIWHSDPRPGEEDDESSLTMAGHTVPISARWREAWRAGDPIIRLVRDLPPAEAEPLQAEGIRSVATVPIFVGQQLWGVVAFDEGRADRVWSDSEVDVLRGAASVIGASLARNRSDEEAAKSRTALRTVIDALPAYINVRDLNLRYTFLNRLEAEWLGVTQEDAIGKTLEEMGARRASPSIETLQHVLRTGETVEAYAEDTTDAVGNPLAWLTTRTPLRGPDGQIEGVLTVSVDITERKKLEEDLRQAQKMEAVGQLTGGVAHDFNNLLAVIVGNLELITEDMGVENPLHEPAEDAMKAALRGAELNHRLLAFARRQPLSPEAVDVNGLLTEMKTMLNRALGNAIIVGTDLQDGLWKAQVDSTQLGTAILNLGVNARDAMPRGGRLTLATRNVTLAEDSPERAEDVTPGDYVLVSVRDTGTGMPPEVVARVFEPFFTTKEKGKGTGLGLSMVYGFVKQSGGQTRIDSEVGKGTAIGLYLPKGQVGEAKAADDTDSPDSLKGRGETILVVEDEPDVRELAKRMLTALGYQVVTAEDGPSAMAALAARPDIPLMLVDVILPGGMYGTAVAAQARERYPDLKIVFMSGYTGGAFENESGQDPNLNLVAKPFRRRDLALKLRQALRGEAR